LLSIITTNWKFAHKKTVDDNVRFHDFELSFAAAEGDTNKEIKDIHLDVRHFWKMLLCIIRSLSKYG